MSFFDSYPIIDYASESGKTKPVIDLFASVRLRDNSIVTEYMLFDEYRISDGETPEIVADKLYGHSRWWWVVLLSSGKTKRSDWPLSEEELEKAILERSGTEPNAIVDFVDSSGERTARRVRQVFYADGVPVTWHERGQGLGSGNNGVIRARGRNVTFAEQMRQENESKRQARLLNVRHLSDFVGEYERLMKSRVPFGSVNF